MLSDWKTTADAMKQVCKVHRLDDIEIALTELVDIDAFAENG